MWLDAKDFAGVVTDLDEDRPVRKVIRVDADQGLVEAFKVDASGNILRYPDGQPIRYMARGRFRVDVTARPKPKKRSPLVGAAQCARCDSKMTLPGDDLCAFCRGKQQGRAMRVEPVTDPLADRPCDNGCGRPATWSVSDETAITPVLGDYGSGKVWYSRGSLVARYWWCSWCYRPPRILDAKGEVIEVIEDAGGCRPE